MINLLPSKYVKNKAPFIVTVISAGLFLVALSAFFIQLVTVTTQIKAENRALMVEKQQTAKLTRAVNDLEKSRSLIIREELVEIKTLQYDVEKIMKTFSTNMTDFNIGLLSYQLDFLKVDGLQSDTAVFDFNEKGQEIIKLNFSTEETSLAKLGNCIENFRKVNWIDDAKFVTMSNNEIYSSTIYLNLLVEKLPKLGDK